MSERHKRSGVAAHGVDATYQGTAGDDEAAGPGEDGKDAGGIPVDILAKRLRTPPAADHPIGGPKHWATVAHLYDDTKG